MIRGQSTLKPASQLALVQRFDPNAPVVHGHGTAAEANKIHKGGKKALVGANPGVPECDHVRMLGKAILPAGHFGVTEPTELKGGTHAGFHKNPLTPAEIESGLTRAQRWHIDAAFYKTHPPRVTSLWHMKLPTGPDLTLRWDDGSDTTMQVPPGRTGFIDCTRMYNELSDEDKVWVDHSEAEYAPSPYQWISGAKAYGNGFNLYSEGLETPYEDLPGSDPALIKTYPLVWVNPLTHEKALSVHGIVVRRLHLRTSKDGPTTVIDDVAEVRDKLYKLQRPFLEPDNILMSPVEEGDLLIWWNRYVPSPAQASHPACSSRGLPSLRAGD